MIRHITKLSCVVVLGPLAQYSILNAMSATTYFAPATRPQVQDSSNSKVPAPQTKRITIRTIVEGPGPIPPFFLDLTSSGKSITTKVDPTPEGVGSAELPVDDRRVSVGMLPLGYEVKSLTHGEVDLTRSLLKITSNPSAEIRIVLSTKSEVPLRNIRGRLSGVSSDARIRLILNAVASDVAFSATVSEDGVFSFSGVPEGVYIPSLGGALPPSGFAPPVIVVKGGDTTSLNLVASQRSASTAIGKAADEPDSRQSKNEMEARLTLGALNTALFTMRSVRNGRYLDIEGLVAERIIAKNYLDVDLGYRFYVVPYTNGYSAVAVPENQQTGRYAYYTSRDWVIHYSNFAPLAPTGQSGSPVK